MAPRFTPVWGNPKGARPASPAAARAAGLAAAAAAPTDAESGTDEADDLRRSLRALDVMRSRGLIGEVEHAERRRDLLGQAERD
jgi:hypothetical protein